NEKGHVFVKDFSFRLTDALESIKKTVVSYLDEINIVPPAITDFTLSAEPKPVAPTRAELGRKTWEADRAQLKIVMELVRDGVFTGTEPQIISLQNKVKTNFKSTYLI
ncbi:hypothetical protein COY25_03330, partial [Candidatus Uhrbacteria bacterium CG_4_10_14_0_2_um_filter_41_7]